MFTSAKKEFYRRRLTAGRYQTLAIYTRALPGDMPSVRASKQAASNAAQRYFNNLSCEEKLRWALCCNFDVKPAAFVTLTFSDDHLPDSRAALRGLVKKWIGKCRRVFKQRGEDFPSIYTIEGQPDRRLSQADTAWETSPWVDGNKWAALDPDNEMPLADEQHRLHAHVFLILPEAEDRELVRSFWPWGKVHINYIRVNDSKSFPRLAAYVTKEARLGIRPVGERSYTPSLGLKKPVIDGRWCDAGESIDYPPGVEDLGERKHSDPTTNTHFRMISYRFPRGNSAAPKSYQSKGRISRSAKSGKSK